jgi:hypothetical protein
MPIGREEKIKKTEGFSTGRETVSIGRDPKNGRFCGADFISISGQIRELEASFNDIVKGRLVLSLRFGRIF